MFSLFSNLYKEASTRCFLLQSPLTAANKGSSGWKVNCVGSMDSFISKLHLVVLASVSALVVFSFSVVFEGGKLDDSPKRPMYSHQYSSQVAG